MPRILRLTIVLILTAATALTSARPARACSCAMSGSPADELAQSAAVFAGWVTDIQSREAESTVVTFQVSDVWKGPARSSLSVQTPPGSAACGYEFEAGQEYLVYAGGSPEALEVTLCSRTRLLAEAAEDLAALGEGEPAPTFIGATPAGATPTPHQIMLPVVGGGPQPAAAPSVVASLSSEAWLLIAAGATAALLLVRAWFNRRTPPKS